ncbi:MAG TPA: hypothetical protein VMR31_05165 [Myxococcota bacterium]|nr:hypothetical protein [Myxococcota bacterium]
MLRLFFLCTRRAELSHGAYLEHLLVRHAPLALRHHARLRGYAIFAVDEALAGAEPLDSINALDYDALADFTAQAYDSPDGERAVTEDHTRFLGGAAGYAAERVLLHDAQPEVPLGSATPGVQWLCALRRRPELALERFERALVDALVPDLLASQPGATRVALGRRVARLFPESAPEWDAVLELGFADGARAPLHPFDSPDCAGVLRRRVAALASRADVWRVREHVQRRAS